jgi:hypothetical protein
MGFTSMGHTGTSIKLKIIILFTGLISVLTEDYKYTQTHNFEVTQIFVETLRYYSNLMKIL